ncbi:MAG: hypothetical protein HY053_05740, partial [Proteobacteria bacterium]|nr:hypothetical protein [Pseudomonadota bacterium]
MADYTQLQTLSQEMLKFRRLHGIEVEYDKHPVLWHANGHLALGPETLSQIDAFIHDRGVDKNSPLYNTSSPFYL